MFAPVYLDHNATTPLDEGALEAMLPYLREQYGNASSRHEYGRAARRAIDDARQRVACALGAHPTEVIFTSGGSEANNLFLKGAAACRKPGLVAISAIEHPCVREPARQLAKTGWRLRELPVDAKCRITSADLGTSTPLDTPNLLSVMMANNETGVLQDLIPLLDGGKGTDVWCHSDAVQAFGKIPVNFRQLNAAGLHALTVSAHKIGGPKGAGALVLDKRVELAPLIAGGGHERGLRSGTENVAAIVGFGVAAERAVASLDLVSRHLSALQATLEIGLGALGASIFGAGAERLPNTSYFAVAGVDGETLVGKLDRAGFAVASGAACSSANPEISRVLQAMAVVPELARGAVRVSLGASNTSQQIHDFLAALAATLGDLKALRAVSA
jgi:cysteine desulfurase